MRLFEDGEFPEGVRALIVDKDRQPKWSPARLADVRPELVAAYLAPLAPGEELGLKPEKGVPDVSPAYNRRRQNSYEGDEMRRKPVSSSVIASVGYTARITRPGSRVPVRPHLPVSRRRPRTYCALLNASSIGTFFNAHIKDEYAFVRIA